MKKLITILIGLSISITYFQNDCLSFQSQPDLVINDIVISTDHPEIGSTLNVEVWIENVGSATASNFYVSLFDGSEIFIRLVNRTVRFRLQ